MAAVVRRPDPMTPAPPGGPVPGGPPAAVRPLVVITDCDHPGIETERAILAVAGLEVRQAHCRTPEDVLAAGQGAVALLVQYAPVTAEVLAGLPACQVVARYGTGLDSIDVAAARARAVEVISVPDYSVQEVSDHAIALVLALCRRVAAAARAVRAGRWDLADAAGVPAALGPAPGRGGAGPDRPGGGGQGVRARLRRGRLRRGAARAAGRALAEPGRTAGHQRRRHPARPAVGPDQAPDRRVRPGPDAAGGGAGQHLARGPDRPGGTAPGAGRRAAGRGGPGCPGGRATRSG